MNRPMAVVGFSLFFTLIAVGLLGYFVAFWTFVVLAAVFLVAAAIFRRGLQTRFIAVTLSVITACAMFCTYTRFIYNRTVSFAGSELNLTLEITDIEGESNGVFYYESRIVKSERKTLIGAKVRITSPNIQAQISDYVHTTAKLDITGATTRASRLYYKSCGIFLKAYIADGYMIEKNPGKSLRYYFFGIKEAISQIISANLNEDGAAVVKGILLGDTCELDGKSTTNFRNVGISHIFCVSGLHVSLISATVYKFLSVILTRKRVLYSATLLAIWFFVAITGFSYSSIRSGVMLSIFYIGRLIGREGDSLNSLGVAAVVLCILNPFSATNISLLYSFFATLGMIILPKPCFRKIKSKILRAFAETAVMSVNVMALTLPIQILCFGTATIISPLANCLVFFAISPLMGCAIIAIILSLFTSVLSSFFFCVCGIIAKYLVYVSDLLAEIPFASIDASMLFIRRLVMTAVMVFLVIAYLGLGKRIRRGATVVCLMMFFGSVICYNVFYSPVMTATVIDSGCATSVVVTQGRNAVVVGCGGSDYTADEILCVLQNKTINTIDLLVLPDKEKTEAFNIDGLSDGIEIENIISGEDYGLLYSLDVGKVSVDAQGECVVGKMTIRYRYTDELRATYIESSDSGLLVVSMISDEYESDGEWYNTDAVISVGRYFTTNNEKINVLCVDSDAACSECEVCYKDGGYIVIDFMRDGEVKSERRL